MQDLPADRVELGEQVPAHPVHVDELDDARLLLERRVRRRRRSAVPAPADRLVRNFSEAKISS